MSNPIYATVFVYFRGWAPFIGLSRCPKIHKTIVVEVGYDWYSIARIDSDGLGFFVFCCTKCNVLRFNRAL